MLSNIINKCYFAISELKIPIDTNSNQIALGSRLLISRSNLNFISVLSAIKVLVN